MEWGDAKALHALPENQHPVYKDEVHFGFLFGIMVEKGAEYGDNDPRK